MSTTRVQQGDLLGPLFYTIVLHPLIYQISDNCKLIRHAWCHDDGTFIGDSKEVAKALDIIQKADPRLGLVLNIHKTTIFWLSCDDCK